MTEVTELGGVVQLDHIDRHIIDALADDARASMAKLADLTHLSRAAVHARFARLRASGVITHFTVCIDPEIAGMHASAYVTLRLVQPVAFGVCERLRQIPEVEHCAQVSGSYDVLVLVRAQNPRELSRTVIQRINHIPGVESTRTLMIFDEWSRAPRFTPSDERRALTTEH